MLKSINKKIEFVIFNHKYILNAFLIKLIYTLLVLFYHWGIEGHLSNEDLINTLEDLDIVMIANLVSFIIKGSYNSFISKDHGYSNENVSSGQLKVKMSTSIMGVSSVHLLKTFIELADKMKMDIVANFEKIIQINSEFIHLQLYIHFAFILGAAVFAGIEYMTIQGHALEHKLEHKQAIATNLTPEKNDTH